MTAQQSLGILNVCLTSAGAPVNVRSRRRLSIRPALFALSHSLQLQQYVERLGATIAKDSDLKIPLKVTVLESEEINAFALPGGFLFVNLCLMNKAESESEFAGVRSSG